jgi:glyceraldehyde 3-phosphate dehydrogenase
MVRVAINGFGRIGRAFFKLALTRPELEIVAVNDLGDIEFLAYLLQYDSAYKKYAGKVSIKKDGDRNVLVVDAPDGKHAETLFISQKDATLLPWRDLSIDIVVESTGVFETYDKMKVHQDAGAKHVVLTAPAKDEDRDGAQTVLVGINEDKFGTCTLSSNGSCTTNSIAAPMQILVEKLGVKKAFLNTVHSYTATQTLIDGPVPRSKDFRRGRAAAMNIAPSSTGAAIALGRVIEPIRGKFDGLALRVPTIAGSMSSITFVSGRSTSREEINQIFKDAEREERWKGILETTNDQIVSTDIVGNPHPAIIDLSLTKVVDGDLCAVYSWYDNEFGYTNSLVEHVVKVAGKI